MRRVSLPTASASVRAVVVVPARHFAFVLVAAHMRAVQRWTRERGAAEAALTIRGAILA